MTNPRGTNRFLAEVKLQVSPFETDTGVTASWALLTMLRRRHGDCASLECERTHSTVSMHIVKEETGKKASPITRPNTWTTRQTTRAPKDEVTCDNHVQDADFGRRY